MPLQRHSSWKSAHTYSCPQFGSMMGRSGGGGGNPGGLGGASGFPAAGTTWLGGAEVEGCCASTGVIMRQV
eukprot:2969715-Pleurochrysis_carterae.AAC.1